MPETLFISDLHLDPERPVITGLFLEFLRQQSGQAEALYILGDLFEAWVGDDDLSEMNTTVCAGIEACVSAGTRVFIMHGNRDFLLGQDFAERCHVTLLDDPACIDLSGTKTLLMHGDLLCTDDTQYQSFRQMVRDPDWQAALLSKSLQERRLMAQEMRRSSREETRGKAESIMDVNPDTVADIMGRHQVEQLIHGHTHRPDVHELVLGDGAAQRIVLGDWYEQGSVLVCSPAGCELQTLPV